MGGRCCAVDAPLEQTNQSFRAPDALVPATTHQKMPKILLPARIIPMVTTMPLSS
jgi:hypothetical protein